MPVGFQCFTPGGDLQIDSEKFTYSLKQKGTLTGTLTTGTFGGGFWVASVTITGCNNPIMFCGMDCLVASSENLGGGTWRFGFYGALGPTIPYACFDVGMTFGGNFGLSLFNSLGQETFSGFSTPLSISASGTENIYTNTSTNLPFTGEPGRTYYFSGAGSYSAIAGTEVFPGDFEAYQNYGLLSAGGSNQYFLSSVGLVGSTNDGALNEGSPGPLYWMIADVTGM